MTVRNLGLVSKTLGRDVFGKVNWVLSFLTVRHTGGCSRKRLGFLALLGFAKQASGFLLVCLPFERSR